MINYILMFYGCFIFLFEGFWCAGGVGSRRSFPWPAAPLKSVRRARNKIYKSKEKMRIEAVFVSWLLDKFRLIPNKYEGPFV